MDGTSPRRKYLLNRGEASPPAGLPSQALRASCPPSVAHATSPSGRRESFPKGEPLAKAESLRVTPDGSPCGSRA